MLVGRRAGRLDDENVVAPDVFLDPHIRLAIGKRTDCRPTERYADIFANALRQVAVGRAAENFQFWLERKHEAATLGARKWPWQPSKLANQLFFGELFSPRFFPNECRRHPNR